jgi:hypothetical protein
MSQPGDSSFLEKVADQSSWKVEGDIEDETVGMAEIIDVVSNEAGSEPESTMVKVDSVTEAEGETEEESVDKEEVGVSGTETAMEVNSVRLQTANEVGIEPKSAMVKVYSVDEHEGDTEEESVDKEVMDVSGSKIELKVNSVHVQMDEEDSDVMSLESNEDEEVKAGESLQDNVDHQDGFETDNVSMNVVVDGQVQVSAVRVDLERLKPKSPEPCTKCSVHPNQSNTDSPAHASAENERAVTSELSPSIKVENDEQTETARDLSMEARECLTQQRNENDSKEEYRTGSRDPSKIQSDNETNIASSETKLRVIADNETASSNLFASKACTAPAVSHSSPKASTRDFNLPPKGRLSAIAYSSLPNTPLEEAAAPDASPINWEKPSWTRMILKTTEAGVIVKQGASLQAPITHIREFVSPVPTVTTSGLSRRRASLPTGTSTSIGAKIDWEKPAWTRPQLKATRAGELVKRGGSLDAPDSPIKSTEGKTLHWTKPSWVKAKLRPTDEGAVAKTKGDLQKPITKVEKRASHSINMEANPMDLRSTETGYEIRLGGSLAGPITHVKRNPMADVNFEANPEFVLQTSETGQAVKQGTTLSKPVTHVNADKDVLRDFNLVAKPTNLRKTGLGQIAKKVGDLQAPITHIERDEMKDINLEANPLALKPTERGFKIRLGDDLSGPITSAPKLKSPMADVNFEANPDLILQPTEQGQAVKQGTSLSKAITHVNIQKDVARDLNFVANPAKLRRTELGELVKTKGDLQKPITHLDKDAMDDINFEANPMILRPTAKGSLLRIGEDLARPITHIARNRTTNGDDIQPRVAGQTDDSTDSVDGTKYEG